MKDTTLDVYGDGYQFGLAMLERAKSEHGDKPEHFWHAFIDAVVQNADKWNCPKCQGTTESAWSPCDDCVAAR